MKITYRLEVDVMRIIFNDGAIEQNDEEKPLSVDYTIAG